MSSAPPRQALGPLRLVRLARYFYGAQLLLATLRSSLQALLVPASFLLFLVCTYGGLLYAFEFEAGLGGARVPLLTRRSGCVFLVTRHLPQSK